MHAPATRVSLAAVLGVLLFIAHASFYLYFFVDDEGITLVYARSLLEGRGLTYANFEGPAEGYSNFLQVVIMAGVLGVVRLAGLPDIWAFPAGGLLSLASGVALVLLVWHLGGRLGLSHLSRAGSAVLLAASGPLAVWSNSSLETVPFALAFMALIAATLPDVRSRGATLAAIAVMLLRVDGALYVGVWLALRFVAGDHTSRQLLGRRVAPAVIATALVYAAGRALYFDSLLPLPLQTKVAHKLAGTPGSVVWSDRGSYLAGFAMQAGWPLMVGLAVAAAAVLRGRRGREAACVIGAAIAVLIGYVSTVGDWMFGFRFFVPLLAPLAVLCAHGITLLEARRPSLARLAVVVALAWAAFGATRFHAYYRDHQRKPSFWSVRSLDPALKFGEYYEAYRALRPIVSPGTRIAYHEAGFVPFMLRAENIDMLGLTSRFIGSAPTDDAILTDVGRYYPLTAEPPHHAVHAYLVSQEPELIVVRKSWMRTANAGRIPADILNAYFRIEDETASFVIYRRTERPIAARRLAVNGLLENLAHPAYAERIAVNDVPLAPGAAAERLPSLWHGGRHEIAVDPAWTLHIDAREPAPVHEVYLEAAPPSSDLSVEVHLKARPGRAPRRLEQTIAKGEPIRVRHTLDAPHETETIEITFTSLTGEPVTVALAAVRVMGQTEELREHVLRHGTP